MECPLLIELFRSLALLEHPQYNSLQKKLYGSLDTSVLSLLFYTLPANTAASAKTDVLLRLPWSQFIAETCCYCMLKA